MRKSILLLVAILLVVGVIPNLGITEAQSGPDPNNYRVPIIGQGTVTRLGTQCSSHEGRGQYLDISVANGNDDEGVPIYSSGNGTVRGAGTTADYRGRYVLIDDGQVAFQYLHLAKVYVSPGQSVSKGDLIGLLGDTGRSIGAHLHWEAWLVSNGTAYNSLYNIPGVSVTYGNPCGNSGSVNGGSLPNNSFTNCPDFYAQGLPNVFLFDHRDCRGNKIELSAGNNYVLSGAYDHVRSIYVPPGKSIYLSPDVNNPDQWGLCHSNDMWNLDVDYYQAQNASGPVSQFQRIGWNNTQYSSWYNPLVGLYRPISYSYEVDGANLVSWVSVFNNSSCTVNGVFFPDTFSGNTPRVGGIDDQYGNNSPWLLEFSRRNTSLFNIEIRTRVDVSAGNYSAHRVLVDGQNIGETSAAEQTINWGTQGWASGNHTIQVQYRRVSDNGNWANALVHTEQIYLSPQREGNISVSPVQVNPNGTVQVSWSSLVPSGNDWISLHNAADPNEQVTLAFQFATSSSGTLNFTAPSNPGSYNFRLFVNGEKVATSNNFEVVTTASQATLWTESSSVSPSGNITVSWTELQTTGNDWVALYYADHETEEVTLAWQYVNTASGSVNFTAPSVPGEFNFRLFRNGQKVATSNSFEVLETVTLWTNETSLNPGESVTVSWSDHAPTGNDWVSLHYADSETEEITIAWQPVTGESGSLEFSVPYELNEYNFRLFRNGTKVATSNSFEVAAPLPVIQGVNFTATGGTNVHLAFVYENADPNATHTVAWTCDNSTDTFTGATNAVSLDHTCPTTGSVSAVITVYGYGNFAQTAAEVTIPDATTTPTHTPTVTATATNTDVPTATTTNTVEAPQGVELLSRALSVSANNGADEDWVDPPSWEVLVGMDFVRITYNLHGLCALGGDASAFVFNQAEWMYISLSNYGQNCLDGVQVVDVPLTDFWNHSGTEQLVPEEGIGGVRVRFWYGSPYSVEVLSAIVMAEGGLQPTNTPALTATQTNTATATDTPMFTETPTSTPTETATSMPTATATNTPFPTETPVPTNTPEPVNEVELLPSPWVLQRSSGGAVEKYQGINQNALQGMDTIRVTYNMHGLCALGGDASALIFDQSGWQYASLSDYGQNCLDGIQTVEIPISHFGNLNPNASVGTMHTRFWNSTGFTVEIFSIVAFDSPNY